MASSRCIAIAAALLVGAQGGKVLECLEKDCGASVLVCKFSPACRGALTCMGKCSDSSCESQCLSDAAEGASTIGAAAIAGVSLEGGAKGCFEYSMQAVNTKALKNAEYLDLATFDGKAAHKWHAENDPVMGGQSSSAVKQLAASLDFSGSTRIVPALKAPGFTIALTEGFPLLSSFPDVSSMDGLTVSIRQVAGSNFTGYKLAFCDSHINFLRCQVESFKADLAIPASANNEFQQIFLPWSKFSDKWSATSGEHTAENPPTASSLKSITQLQLWTEAQEGDFHVELQYVRATKAPAVAARAILV